MSGRIALFAIAALLVGAHFLRAGNPVLAAVCVCAPLLFLYRKRRVLLALQLLAYGAAATWIVVGVRLIQARLLSGQPWNLAAIIIAVVTLFTLVAGLLLNSPKAREHYPP